jgi:hypothetical protein
MMGLLLVGGRGGMSWRDGGGIETMDILVPGGLLVKLIFGFSWITGLLTLLTSCFEDGE